MILSFSKPQFKTRILSGRKLFTLRHDTGKRWQPGMKIHFWLHNPRTKKYHPDAHQFATGKCGSVNDIELSIQYYGSGGCKEPIPDELIDHAMILIQYADGHIEQQLEDFAIADGFDDLKEFIKYWGIGNHKLRQIYFEDVQG